MQASPDCPECGSPDVDMPLDNVYKCYECGCYFEDDPPVPEPKQRRVSFDDE